MLKQLLRLAVFALLAACGNDPAEPTAEVELPPTPSVTPAETDELASQRGTDESSIANETVTLAPGTHCYTINSENLTGTVRLTINSAAEVDGDSNIVVHNAAAGYYSSYVQEFAGNLDGDQADLIVTTWIEYDRQTDTEIWTVTPEALTVQSDTFVAADCDTEAVTNYFSDPDGLDAETLLGDLANQSGQRVEFAPGTSGTVLENALVRGDRDLYVLGAQGGQSMTLTITALEDNAVFDVISPSGYVLVREGTNENLVLPQTGDYQIIVGGTRGNATYRLELAIE